MTQYNLLDFNAVSFVMRDSNNPKAMFYTTNLWISKNKIFFRNGYYQDFSFPDPRSISVTFQ